MNKKMQKWYESLTPEQRGKIDSNVATVISWGYMVGSGSGGCMPDPDDTVRIYADSDGVTLTDQEALFLAAIVKDEFR